MSCSGIASMRMPNMTVLQRSFQQPTNNGCASLNAWFGHLQLLLPDMQCLVLSSVLATADSQ
eukprot:2535369-Prorocentrum_lima.AAC.1